MSAQVTYVKDLKIDDVAIPAKNASLSLEGAQTDITNFITAGINGIKSFITGLLDGSISADGNLSSIQGYKMTLKKTGTSTSFSAEAATSLGSNRYQMTNTAKRWLDPATALVIRDDSTPVVPTDIDWLFGIVTLGSPPGGTVTFHSGNYLPIADVAQNNGSVELSLTADVLDATDRPTALSNGGLKINLIGLIDSSLSAERLDDLVGTYKDLLLARTPFGIEMSFASGALLCRGWYTLKTVNGEGPVDGLEMEKLEFAPYGPSLGEAFSYQYTGSFNAGLGDLLDAFFGRDAVEVKYLIDGTNGHSMSCLVAEFTISADMDAETFSTKLVTAGGGLSDEP